MIPQWEAVMREAVSHLTPGGALHVVDFGGQERLPAWFRAGLRQWLARFHVSPRDALQAELELLPAEPERSSASSDLTEAMPSMPSSDAEGVGWRAAAPA